MTHEPLSVPTRLPPPTPIYPSPTSLDRPMDRPPQYRPLLSRSESNPQYPHPHHHHHHLLPRPPAIRTGTSPTIVNGELVITGAVGAVSMAESKKSEEEEREELTTKGRKRKRLAKACSACHKNKRRCDGFAPCSNCEFSSRPCLYVNAQGEIIPPPRTRETTAAPRKDDNGKTITGGTSATPEKRGSGDAQSGVWGSNDDVTTAGRGEKERVFVDPLELVEHDAAFSSELVDLFLARIHPFGSMIHPPTFYYRFYLSRVSPLLLDAMYAFVAHLSTNPKFLSTLSPNTPTWARGEAFAERARHSAKRMISLRASWSEEERRLDRGTWEETEFTQALFLLSFYFVATRQSSLGLYFLDVAIEILRPASTATVPPPSPLLNLSPIEYSTLMEARNRTFWLLVLDDLCAAANGRPRILMDHEIYNVPLPGDETQWERWGGGGSSGRETARRDGLALGTGNWQGEEGLVGELGHVLRILALFCDIMLVANHGGPGGENRGNPAHFEQALKNWALSLPRNLRFDEHNLATAVTLLSSPVHTINRSGWLFAYMHTLAESGMFYLQAALAGTGASWTAQRQSQAVDNIAVILEAVGPRGRESPLMAFPTLVVTNWHEHLRTSPSPPTAQQIMLEERLGIWWEEVNQAWGLERGLSTERGMYPNHMATPAPRSIQLHIPSPHPISTNLNTTTTAAYASNDAPNARNNHGPQAASGLGLVGASPPPLRAPDSAISNSSSITLPTPNPTHHTYRYSQSHLPPLRPRANTITFSGGGSVTIKSPSPDLHMGRRQLPSMSALSDSHYSDMIKLPPLPSMDLPFKYGSMSSIAGLFDRDRDMERDRGMISPISPRDRRESRDGRDDGAGKVEKGLNVSPRYTPYSRDRDRSDYKQEDRSSTTVVSPITEKRPRLISPLATSERVGWGDEWQIRKENGTEMGGGNDQEREWEREWEREKCGPLGIAALISAAEEKSREREVVGPRCSVPA